MAAYGRDWAGELTGEGVCTAGAGLGWTGQFPTQHGVKPAYPKGEWPMPEFPAIQNQRSVVIIYCVVQFVQYILQKYLKN